MSNKIAELKLNERTGKWEAKYNGQILAASRSKAYVIEMITSGRCNKANDAGVSQVYEPEGTMTVGENSSGVVMEMPEERFTINERFDFLTKFVTMVARRTAPSLVVTGEGGLGKTFTVTEALGAAGLINTTDYMGSVEVGTGSDSVLSPSESRKLYTVVKGYSTAKGLYRTLYENRNRIIVFDDCDSVLRDPVSLNLLKGALDSYERRIISWNAESFGDDDLPRSFEFKGGVIFISNLPMHKVDQAVRSRSIPVDLSMNASQKIERMGEIIKSEKFLPEYEMEHKKAALEFLGEMKDVARELSFRTLISVTKVVAEGDDWKRPAEYLLTSSN
jgi:hypothetical protein